VEGKETVKPAPRIIAQGDHALEPNSPCAGCGSWVTVLKAAKHRLEIGLCKRGFPAPPDATTCIFEKEKQLEVNDGKVAV